MKYLNFFLKFDYFIVLFNPPKSNLEKKKEKTISIVKR